MATILDILPIITILSMGGGIWWILNKISHYSLRKTEYFNIFLTLGSFSLILPLTWIGIQPNGILTLSFRSFKFDLIDFPGYCMLFLTISLVLAFIFAYNALRQFLKTLEGFHVELAQVINFRFLLLGLLIFDYFFLQLILPLRGFDALYYYFPEAEVFFQTGRITEANYYSFLPVAKSPLNVLLYVYTYYITSDLAIHFLPLLFLLGLVALAYDFSMELFDDKSIAIIAAIFILVLPFTYWLMNYWAFYQDLYLCYFFSVTCYFSLKWYKNPSKRFFALYLTIGIICSFLTKITAWTIPIILLLWLPTGYRGKSFRLILLMILGIFLCLQAMTRIYIGITVILALLFVVIAFLILKEQKPSITQHYLIRIIPIGIGMIIGSFWLLNRIALSPLVREEIFDLYFRLSKSIMWIYPEQPHDPLLHTLETVHKVNFFSAMSILLLGTVFVLPWFILKISAMKNFEMITAPLIWILVFFGIWSTYYLNNSIRYLAPIIIPMVVSISWGLYQLIKKIDESHKQEFFIILCAFLGCSNIYYLIPLEDIILSDSTQNAVGTSYNQSAFSYYSHPEFLIFQAILFSLLVIILIRKSLIVSLPIFKKKINVIWVRKVLFIGIIIIPIAVQSFLLIYTHGNLTEFHAIYEYEYREEYQDLVTVIQQQNQPFAAILTVRTVGLQFFTKQPVLDIYYQRSLFLGDPFFTYSSITEIIDVLHYPLNYTIQTDYDYNITISLKFIVVPTYKNIYFNIYQNEIKAKSLLFQALDYSSYFTIIYRNSDFKLFEVNFEE